MSEIQTDFKPVANDVIVQFENQMWEARNYVKGETPKLVFRSENKTEVRRKASEFAKSFASKVYLRLRSGNIILDDKDNAHNVAAIADGGIEEEPTAEAK